ncbi:MAG: hypothetical protein J6Y94_03860 [Bacteriovoracaceae bacterium]|nr:hypothetical protein [Bacteriovoracaceae bacterium]
MKKFGAVLCLGVLLALVSCTITGPVAVSSNSVGPKRAHGCMYSILGGLITSGQNNLYVTAKGAGISKISTVDVKNTYYIPFIVSKHCTYISGN